MAIRPFVKEDILPLKEILLTTRVFRNEEIEVAVELMEIVTEEPHQLDYIMFTSVDNNNGVQGYYCVGPTPMTEVICIGSPSIRTSTEAEQAEN